MDGIDTTTHVVYGNAFQLDAKFDTASAPTEVINGLFEKPDGKQLRIPMLHRIDTMLYYESDLYKAAELALGSDTVSLVVVVPKQNEFSLVEQSITSVIANFDQSAHLQKLDFTLPLFEVDSTSRNDAAISSANSEILILSSRHVMPMATARPYQPGPIMKISMGWVTWNWAIPR